MTDYDAIAEQYRASKEADWRTAAEVPSFLALVGDVTGKTVLDLACGEGFYTRKLAQAGAARVVGVDSSPAMIDLARRAEHRAPLGVDYRVGDVRGLDLGRHFDLVVAAYLLNYAPDPEALAEMCAAVVRHLPPGGRFVSINSNPETAALPVDYRPYGFDKLAPADLAEGSPYVWRNYQGDDTFDLTVYHLGRPTHERIFAAAGLTDVRWVPLQVAPEAVRAHGPGFWETFLTIAPVVLIEARRPGDAAGRGPA